MALLLLRLEMRDHCGIISGRHVGQAGYAERRKLPAYSVKARRLTAQRGAQPSIFIEKATRISIQIAFKPGRCSRSEQKEFERK
jgi:hypothetical protein